MNINLTKNKVTENNFIINEGMFHHLSVSYKVFILLFYFYIYLFVNYMYNTLKINIHLYIFYFYTEYL